MSKKKHTKNNTENNTSSTEEKKDECFEAFIKSGELKLADFEKLGSALMVIGYANFFRSAELDICEILGNEELGVNPALLTIKGQQQEFFGLLVLYLVADGRLRQKALEKQNTEEPIDLAPYRTIAMSYLISVLANFIRLQALINLERESESNITVE